MFQNVQACVEQPAADKDKAEGKQTNRWRDHVRCGKHLWEVFWFTETSSAADIMFVHTQVLKMLKCSRLLLQFRLNMSATDASELFSWFVKQHFENLWLTSLFWCILFLVKRWRGNICCMGRGRLPEWICWDTSCYNGCKNAFYRDTGTYFICDLAAKRCNKGLNNFFFYKCTDNVWQNLNKEMRWGQKYM